MNPYTKHLRILGLVGILGTAMMFASDCLIMDSSASGEEFGEIALKRLTEAPNWRLTLGGIGGPIAACVLVVGFGHVFLALQTGGKATAFLCAAGFACGYVILGSWHAAGPMFAFINRMQPDSSNPLAHEGWTYLASLGLVGFVPAASSMLLLLLLVLFRTTLYPKWFAILNPGLIYICTTLFVFAPSPFGGYLVMGSGSLSFLAFFIASTAILWNAVPDASYSDADSGHGNAV